MEVAQARRLLVVDDDDAVREVTSEMLTILGYESDAVSSGPKAIKRLREQRYDLLLLDVAMPTMSGAEVVATLDEEDMVVPTILMTGFAESDVSDLIENFESPRAVLSKPFPMKELQAAVEQMFEMAGARRTA
jgi:CheY-like chemotaxis protein